MPDKHVPESRERKRSLLSLVPAEQGADTDTDMVDAASEDMPSATERHRIARSRREASVSPLVAALGRKDTAETTAPAALEPFAEQERELKALLSGGSTRPRPDAVHSATASEPSGKDPETGVPLAERAPAPVAAPVSAMADDPYGRPLIDPMSVIRGVIASRWIIAGTTLGGALLAAFVALSIPKHYVAYTELLVDPRQLRIVQSDLNDGSLTAEATLAIVENQVRVLRSGTVLGAVVDRLGLDKDPEFNGTRSSPLFGFVSELRSLFSVRRTEGAAETRRRALAMEHLAAATDVERGGKTFVISVAAKTESPDKSALIANSLAEVFLETYGSIQAGAAGRASDEIGARLAELREGVEQAERKVETFKAENDIIDAQGRLISDDEIVKLNDQLGIARARTLELHARADSARNVTVDTVVTGNLPEQMSSPVLTEIRTQYALLNQEADRIAARLGPRHPERLAIDEQVAAARQRIEQELRLVASSIQVELRRAVQLEQELAARLAQLKARQAGLSGELVTLRELEREATAKRAVYEAFLLRARETGEQRDLNTANVSVISTAQPPLEAAGMSRMLMTLMGAFLGLGAGVAFGAGRGAFESIRSERFGGGSAAAPARPAPPVPPVAPRSEPKAETVREEAPPTNAAEKAPVSVAQPADPVEEKIVGARIEAQELDEEQATADPAEEADMYHSRPQPQPAWQYDSAARGDHQPHQLTQQAWPQGVQQRPAQEQESPWVRYPEPSANPQYLHQQHQQHQHQQFAAAQPYHQMNPQAPVYPQAQQPHAYPQGYGSSYAQQPQVWYGQAPAQEPMPQQMPHPMYANGYGQQPPMAAHQPPMGWNGAPAPVQAYGYPQHNGQQQPMAAQPQWQQPAWPQHAPMEQPRQPQAMAAQPAVASADAGEKSAIDEIRDSLREFREAVRELAENRNRRRRFL